MNPVSYHAICPVQDIKQGRANQNTAKLKLFMSHYDNFFFPWKVVQHNENNKNVKEMKSFQFIQLLDPLLML